MLVFGVGPMFCSLLLAAVLEWQRIRLWLVEAEKVERWSAPTLSFRLFLQRGEIQNGEHIQEPWEDPKDLLNPQNAEG